MSCADQKAGSCYIRLISCFLFICIVTGGIFLTVYITQPESESTSWFFIAGVALACLPWLFWFLIYLYRILSRAFGFRMVCWGATYDSDDGSLHGEDDYPESGDGATKVHFGEAVGVGEEEGRSSEANESSIPMKSELPLKLSMSP
ncbi:hypothetical protein Nepgr_012241 [Nepenthes gracilis]|uniref:Uncharacterized protein n=1 Tax=Nepenthes gracilis TaxID=150966 RepID=A0AAD3SFE2_NEPGR|nr:hypothetical protein Nepgr_012241 [Nepenthes gracilis]